MSDKEEKPEKKPYADKDSIPPGRLSPEEYAKAKKEKLKRDSENYVKANNLRADFAYWAKATTWTIPETVFLINGIDPDKALSSPKNLYQRALEYHLEPFVTIERQWKLIQRAASDGRLAERNKPVSSLYWCDEVELDMPVELVELVSKQTSKIIERDELIKKHEARETKESKPNQESEPGVLKLSNERRIWAWTLKVFKEKTGLKQNQIVDMIHSNFTEDDAEYLKQKGMEKRTIDDVWGKANKILKQDKEEE
jgi:hypothetical protein